MEWWGGGRALGPPSAGERRLEDQPPYLERLVGFTRR